MLVTEAAKKIGVNSQKLRLGLRQRLFPFGEAIKTSENRHICYVNRNGYEQYLDGGRSNAHK